MLTWLFGRLHEPACLQTQSLSIFPVVGTSREPFAGPFRSQVCNASRFPACSSFPRAACPTPELLLTFEAWAFLTDRRYTANAWVLVTM